MFSATVADHAGAPRNLCDLDGADAVGQSGSPGEGPYMLMGLWVNAQIIRQARFETYGCPVARACGSWVTEWLHDRPLKVAAVLEAGDLERVMGGLPTGKEYCAALAVGATKDGLS